MCWPCNECKHARLALEPVLRLSSHVAIEAFSLCRLQHSIPQGGWTLLSRKLCLGAFVAAPGWMPESTRSTTAAAEHSVGRLDRFVTQPVGISNILWRCTMLHA